MAGKSPFSHVMLMVNGTNTALKAADYAVRLCAFAAARLTAVAVIDTDTAHQLLSARILVHTEMRELETELQSSAEKQLKHIIHMAAAEGVTVETTLIRGSLHGAFLEEIQRRRPDFVVLGGFSSSITRRDLSARERQRVIDEVHIPVLLIW